MWKYSRYQVGTARWEKSYGEKTLQMKSLKVDYRGIKEKLTNSIQKELTIQEIKGRDKSPLIIITKKIGIW